MGKNAFLGLKNGLNWLQKSVCLLENCLFEPVLGVKSGSKPMDTGARSYFIDSKSTQPRSHANSVAQTNLPLGRLPSHISSKANRATDGLGLHHQRANGFNHLCPRIVVM
jgi:hypothetical protein